MKSFCWEDNNQVFILDGNRWGVVERLNPKTGLRDLVNVMLPKDESQDTPSSNVEGSVIESQKLLKPSGVLPTTPQQNVTDNLAITTDNICFCGNIIPGKRIDRKYCSPKCRKAASRGKQLVLAGVARISN